MKANDKCDDSFCTFTNPFIREKLKILDMKLIDLYKEWMEDGNLPKCGLCNSVPEAYKNNLNEFKPERLRNTLSGRYWGCGDGHTDLFEIAYRFTPLRQTIVLLICAMNNEL